MERSTRQRSAISTVIDAAHRPLSPQEIVEGVQVAGVPIGIATVYRNLKLLVDDGLIQAVNLPGENPRYESTEHAHHHHFQCNECKKVFDVEGCPGNMKKLAPKGFTVERHELTLYGQCADCRAVIASGRAKARKAGMNAA